MEVIGAVLVGALLWLIGPGRRLWAVATAGSAGARKTRSSLPPPNARARASRPPALPPRPVLRMRHGEARDSRPLPLESPAVSLELSTSAADPHELRRTPITLGVALLLQAIGLGVMALVFAVAYFTLELKLRAEARALERRVLRQVMALEASQTSTRQALEAMQASLAAQVRPPEQLEPAPPKPIKSRAH